MRFFPHTFVKLVVLILAASFVFPSALLAMPQKAQAQGGVPYSTVLDAPTLINFVKTAYGVLQQALVQVNTYTTMLASYAQTVNTYILQPLAFVLSGQLMKALTASVMKFVVGKANGTGIPQFAVDVQKSLRSISDFQTQAYLRQVSLTNSPFASSIAQALGINYSQSTSLAGFWAANQNTLGQSIPTYQPGYLAGNWSQGGTAAWFQLTTQTQNNPYILYQSTQAQLSTVIGSGVGGGSGARLAQLSWGQGFMSWCSTSDAATQAQNAALTAQSACIAAGGSPSYCEHAYANAGGAEGGVNPGDPCTNADGTPGVIQTPGSTIKATLDKVLGGQQDKLVQMGNISAQVNSILSNIGTVLNTVNLAANILGGSSGNGLLNSVSPNGALVVSNSTGSAPPGFGQGGYFGTTNSQINSQTTSIGAGGIGSITTSANYDPNAVAASVPNNANADGLTTTVSSGTSDMLARVKSYQNAWGAIGLSASTTAAALQNMMAVCHAYFNGSTSSYELAAQNALSSEVSPVLTQAAGIQAIADAATAQYNLVQSESASSTTYAADLQKLNTMPPTASDVSTAQYNATAYGGATANPAGSLTVSGSSIIDQMNLIRNNAASIQSSSCTANVILGGA